MKLFARLMTAAAFGLTALAASASPADPKSGVEYRTLATPQATEAGQKVEVTEFFWYGCPHCYAFDPALSDWVRKNAANITFKRIPVFFRDTFLAQQKMYFALEAMGQVEAMHPKIFAYMHVERKPLDTDAQVLAFVTRYGIDKTKFLDAYNSFGTQTKVRRAQQMQAAYKIDQVPMIAIDGRYLTSPSEAVKGMSGNHTEAAYQAAVVQVMNHLVAKAAQAKAPAGK